MPQPKDCSSSTSNEFAGGAITGHGALTPLKQMLLSNVLAPAVAEFLISTPVLGL